MRRILAPSRSRRPASSAPASAPPPPSPPLLSGSGVAEAQAAFNEFCDLGGRKFAGLRKAKALIDWRPAGEAIDLAICPLDAPRYPGAPIYLYWSLEARGGTCRPCFFHNIGNKLDRALKALQLPGVGERPGSHWHFMAGNGRRWLLSTQQLKKTTRPSERNWLHGAMRKVWRLCV